MSTTIERLLLVQERDRRIAELTRERQDLPVRIKQLEMRLDAHKESLKLAQEELKKNAAAMKQVDIEVESQKQKINKLREQQFQIKSNEEYKALEREIALIQKQIRGLEDQELALMEQTDGLRKMIAEREKDLKQEEGRVVEDQSGLKKHAEGIDAEIADLQRDRETLAKDVEPAWLSRYERIFKRTGDFAVVRIEVRKSGNSCGGCHMTLPPQVVHNARKNMALTECSYCSRILYWQP